MTTIERPGTDIRDFHNETKRRRYDSDRYIGATGLNWFTCDPTLQFLADFYLDDEAKASAWPELERLGALMGGPVSERAEVTDKHPPYLVKYDRWGHDISEVVLPASAEESKRDLIAARRRLHSVLGRGGPSGAFVNAAYSYMLNQAEVGMACALGTGGDMIEDLVDRFAPADIRDSLMPRIEAGEFDGETAQMLTERTGGSDLGQIETTATPVGDSYLLNGVKWFASNANGKAFVVLAKPEGATDDVKGVNSFLVLLERRDGSRNGVHIRQLKDKLGTKAVASCEIEFHDAEAFILSGKSDGHTGDGAGLSRMMALTNGSRLGVAMMGLGCARRSLVESLCYARAREAFGAPILQHPLMRRKLAELIVEVEATQALVFEGYGLGNKLRTGESKRMRLSPALVKLKAARLGITAASDAIEVHGGNGYCETWPVARILRDAQVNTVWEGTDNILCLDVRRAIEREQADVPFIARLREAVSNAGEGATVRLVSGRIDELEETITAWKGLRREIGEARLYPLAQFMIDVMAGALLIEQAKFDQDRGGTRKALVAALFAQMHLMDGRALRGIDRPEEDALTHFDELAAGALTIHD